MDLSSVLADPELGFTGFTVLRTNYIRQNGDSVPSNETLPASGCIHPGTPETLQLLPEEEKHKDFIAVYTSFPLSMGNNPGGVTWKAADRILYDGKVWKLVRLRDWSQFSYYQGLAVLTDEETI